MRVLYGGERRFFILERRMFSPGQCGTFSLSFKVTEVWGNWGVFEKSYCLCDPCVGSCGAEVSQTIGWDHGDFPER